MEKAKIQKDMKGHLQAHTMRYMPTRCDDKSYERYILQTSSMPGITKHDSPVSLNLAFNRQASKPALIRQEGISAPWDRRSPLEATTRKCMLPAATCQHTKVDEANLRQYEGPESLWALSCAADKGDAYSIEKYYCQKRGAWKV